MKNIKSIFPLLAVVIVIFTACGNGGNEAKTKDTASSNSTPNGPAPDNSSATNPSLGDTLRNQKDTVNSDTLR